MTLPLAHLGHYLWVFYLLPVLIVVGGIVRSRYMAKRQSTTSVSPSSGEATISERPPDEPSP